MYIFPSAPCTLKVPYFNFSTSTTEIMADKALLIQIIQYARRQASLQFKDLFDIEHAQPQMQEQGLLA